VGPLVRRIAPCTRFLVIGLARLLYVLQTSASLAATSHCVVAKHSLQQLGVEDFHLPAREHAENTTKPLSAVGLSGPRRRNTGMIKCTEHGACERPKNLTAAEDLARLPPCHDWYFKVLVADDDFPCPRVYHDTRDMAPRPRSDAKNAINDAVLLGHRSPTNRMFRF